MNVAENFVSLLSWFFGDLDNYLEVFLTITIIDLILEYLDAFFIQKSKFNLMKILTEISKKTAVLFLIGLANVIDSSLTNKSTNFKIWVIVFYAVNDGIDLLQHAGNLGIPVPNFILSKLRNIRQKLDEKELNVKSVEQVKEDFFDIRDYINIGEVENEEMNQDEEKKHIAPIDKISEYEKSVFNKDFLESLTGIYSDNVDF